MVDQRQQGESGGGGGGVRGRRRIRGRSRSVGGWTAEGGRGSRRGRCRRPFQGIVLGGHVQCMRDDCVCHLAFFMSIPVYD
eukprot:6454217-Pyramimonas_sp.AAC.1